MFRYKNNLFLIALVAGLIACGDDSTGPDVEPEDAPEFPQVQNEEAQPDFSFFEDNQPKASENEAFAETNNYYEARSMALANQFTFTFAGVYSGFLLAGSGEEATFEDGMWVWEYSYSYENESVSIRVTAEEVADGYRWAMYWSYDDGETSFENYKVMEGIVSEDGSSGEWTFNALDENTNEERIAYTSEWNVASDTEKTMTVNWYDDAEELSLSASYEENQPEHLLSIMYDDEPDISIFWDTDTQQGYYESDGERLCWDENFQDAECS